jgi:hypothetical protein
METLNRLHILQEVLTECGYSEWHVVEPGSFAAYLLLINPKNKKIAEILIPNEWLNDPHERKTIGESLAMTIEKLQVQSI